MELGFDYNDMMDEYMAIKHQDQLLYELTTEIFALLQNWFNAIEEGNAEDRYPDPFTKFDMPQERVDRIILAIDEEHQTEVNGFLGRQLNTDAGPGFARLSPLARRALVEAIFSIVRKYEEKGFTN